MAIAQKEELLKYIKSAIELETDILTQTDLIDAYNEDMEYREPELFIDDLPHMPSLPVAEKPDGNLLVSAILVAVMGLSVGFVCLSYNAMIDFCILSIIIGLLSTGWAIWLIMSPQLAVNKEYKNVYLPAMQRVQEEEERIKKSNAEEKKEYEQQHNEWERNYATVSAKLRQHIDQTQSVLTALYEKNVIYPKYRNLPALTSIYEYLVTGRCEELAGSHGAYNMYEDEMRKDTVICQLNSVIENLEQIRQNQYMLYQQVKAIQENTSTIVSELEEIEGYTIQIAQLTALNAYYAALNERNTRITMYYHL